jgi:LysM repeat protein
MPNRSKSAGCGIAILVVLWILIIILLPKQPAGNATVGKESDSITSPEPSRASPDGTPFESPLPTPLPTETPTPTLTPTPQLLQPVTHLIQAGETLQMIADQHSTSVNLLAGYLTVDELSPGNEIVILAPNPAACPSRRIHLVVENETLYSIAQRYEVSLEVLMAENHLTDPLIGIGSTLCIPGP